MVRLAAWAVVPGSRFASDEEGYFQAATVLLVQGRQDLFWPPVTGWLIAAVRWLLHSDALPLVRLAWIAMDVGSLMALQTLARRVGAAVFQGDGAPAATMAAVATAAYALYLPAIAHAQFLTSETPALLQTLCLLVLISRPDAGLVASACAGALAGTLALTRPSLLPLLVLMPLAAAATPPTRGAVRRALGFILVGGVLVGAVVIRNGMSAGEFTIAKNSAYNLYIGNRDFYAEDLNLFSPRATAEQIEFRRQMWSGELAYPTGSPAELQREAIGWIIAHPWTSARRALGRLARVFVPKTDVLELAGGEQSAGIWSSVSRALLVAANVQWAIVLFGGLAGLLIVWHRSPLLGRLCVATIAGSVVLCLVAISKPRYSFVFDPLLIVGAAVLAARPSLARSVLERRDRWLLAAVYAFLVWGWIAWLIFALSSRRPS